MLFNKCPHCLMILEIGQTKCSNPECKKARDKKARLERIRKMKNRSEEYYSSRLREDIRCKSCGKAYPCLNLNAKNLVKNSYFGTCLECKSLAKAS